MLTVLPSQLEGTSRFNSFPRNLQPRGIPRTTANRTANVQAVTHGVLSLCLILLHSTSLFARKERKVAVIVEDRDAKEAVEWSVCVKVEKMGEEGWGKKDGDGGGQNTI